MADGLDALLRTVIGLAQEHNIPKGDTFTIGKYIFKG
jgi:hypothetical protein